MASSPQRLPSGVHSTDELCDVLVNPDRRIALHLLDTHDGPVDVTALARDVAAVRAREQPGAGGEAGYERLCLRFRHCHAPKMADAGIVDYDPAASTIELVADLPPIGVLGKA